MSDESTGTGEGFLREEDRVVGRAARVIEEYVISPPLQAGESFKLMHPGETTVRAHGPNLTVMESSDPTLALFELAQLAEAESRPVDVTDPDAPEISAEAWAAAREARRRRLLKPVKEAISIRLDADVLAWFRQQGPGYQREINRLLRERMEMMGGGS